jgi:single-strand DNA-binding protein
VSEKFEMTGVVHKVFATKQITDRFSKREFVLHVEDGKYPQVVIFEMSGDKASQLDGIATGEEVTVHFNVRGREHTKPGAETRYYNSLHAWRVEPAQQKQKAPPPRDEPPPPPPAEDDCPF